jgi:hypothetical protein
MAKKLIDVMKTKTLEKLKRKGLQRYDEDQNLGEIEQKRSS